MDSYYQGNGYGGNCQCSPYADCQQEEEDEQYEDDDACECSPDAPCQQDQQNDETMCECSEDAPCQQPAELSCSCSKNAMCKKSPGEKQLLELATMGLLRAELEEFDFDPLLEEPYSNVDLTNSQVLIVEVAGDEDIPEAENKGDVVVFDPDELFLYVAPQSHNLIVQRQRLLDSYIEDLSISEVEEAAVALRLLVNLFRQRRMDMNKMVPLFSMGKPERKACGCD